MRLIALIFPVVLYAGQLWGPANVLHVLNENSTLDKDANGIVDCQQSLNEWFAIYGDTSNVVRIKTSITYNTADHAQSIHWDLFSMGFDTSSRWGDDASVSLSVGNEYIRDEICEYYEADSAWRWSNLPFIAIHTDFPIKLRGNSKVGATPEDSQDSCIYRSMCSALMLHIRPGCDGIDSDNLTGWNAKRWQNISYAAKKKRFVPGSELIVATGITNFDEVDSLSLWVLPTFIDGDSIGHIISALRKSAIPLLSNSSAGSSDWFVIDQAGTGTLNTYNSTDTVTSAMHSYWGDRVLRDIDSVSLAATDTVYLGWSGDPTLRSGDSCSFYICDGSYHSPTPDSSEYWIRQVGFKIASPAIAIFWESYYGYSHAGNIRPTAVQTQSLESELIRAGFAYTIGNSHEPTALGMPYLERILTSMKTPGITFAEVAWAASLYSYWQYQPIGNPIGIMNSQDSKQGWGKWSKW